MFIKPYRLGMLAALVLIVAGCDTNLLQNSQKEAVHRDLQQLPVAGFGKATLEELQDIPRLELDLPSELQSWEEDVSVLRDSIAAHDGQAIIGLKAPGSERMRTNNNIREALTANQFEAGIRMLLDRNIEITDVYNTFGGVVVRMDPDEVFELFEHPRVDYIDFPMRYEHMSSPLKHLPVPLASFSQITPWGISMVNAPQSWSITTGTGTSVMVIDTGMENHEDLPDRPAENCGGLFDGCSDGPNFHGTHVSGILMALNNSIGVVGVAPGLEDNDVYSWGACDPNPHGLGCSTEAIAAGINAATNAGVDVINMSLGGPSSQSSIANAVSAAWGNGIVLVAAAGNHPNQLNINPGDVVYPANYWQVVGVSGIRDTGAFASTSPCIVNGVNAYSNHGPHVDISAPFWALSTVETSSYEDENEGWCGTSMATPHVSGAAALLRIQNPGWSNQQIVDKLVCTANHPDGGFSYDENYGYGVLDVEAAVTSTSGAAFAMVSWLNPVAESGDINISFKGHSTPISVTPSSNIVHAIINGINSDGSANLTATGGGGNRILFQSNTTGSSDNGQWIHIDFNPNWMDPNGNVFSDTSIQVSCGHD